MTDSPGVDVIQTRDEYVHPAELAGALEAFRDKEIDGKIVAAQYPTEENRGIKLTWAYTVPEGDVIRCLYCGERYTEDEIPHHCKTSQEGDSV